MVAQYEQEYKNLGLNVNQQVELVPLVEMAEESQSEVPLSSAMRSSQLRKKNA